MSDFSLLHLIIADFRARDVMGRKHYGDSLRASSSNDALVFAYEEALDLAMYSRQEIERRRGGGDMLIVDLVIQDLRAGLVDGLCADVELLHAYEMSLELVRIYRRMIERKK